MRKEQPEQSGAEGRLLMNRIILADDQAIFRAGTARVLALEEDMRIIAQCEDTTRLFAAVGSFRSSIVIFSKGLGLDLKSFAAQLDGAGSFGILMVEKDEHIAEEISTTFAGVIGRGITGVELIDCVRRVGKGQHYRKYGGLAAVPPADAVGARVRDRLTPKELQIVALIVQGCKNKDIANQLGTKEQVIKNYLRSIFDKTGVGDRLELALFTLHHRVLNEAATHAGTLIHKKSA
jgi:DNA-binding NarL/FixJ family response regulator